MDPTVLLTRRQAAAHAQVTARTITRWARQGRLQAVRQPDGRRLYKPAHVTHAAQTALTHGGGTR